MQRVLKYVGVHREQVVQYDCACFWFPGGSQICVACGTLHTSMCHTEECKSHQLPA